MLQIAQEFQLNVSLLLAVLHFAAIYSGFSLKLKKIKTISLHPSHLLVSSKIVVICLHRAHLSPSSNSVIHLLFSFLIIIIIFISSESCRGDDGEMEKDRCLSFPLRIRLGIIIRSSLFHGKDVNAMWGAVKEKNLCNGNRCWVIFHPLMRSVTGGHCNADDQQRGREGKIF